MYSDRKILSLFFYLEMKEPLHDLAYHIGYIIGLQNICGCFNKPAYRVFSTESRQGKQKESNIFQVSVYNQNTTLLWTKEVSEKNSFFFFSLAAPLQWLLLQLLLTKWTHYSLAFNQLTKLSGKIYENFFMKNWC